MRMNRNDGAPTVLPNSFRSTHPVAATRHALHVVAEHSGVDTSSLATRGSLLARGIPATVEAAVASAYGHPDPGSADPDSIARTAVASGFISDDTQREGFLQAALTVEGLAAVDAVFALDDDVDVSGDILFKALPDAVFLSQVVSPHDAAETAVEQQLSTC